MDDTQDIVLTVPTDPVQYALSIDTDGRLTIEVIGPNTSTTLLLPPSVSNALAAFLNIDQVRDRIGTARIRSDSQRPNQLVLVWPEQTT